MKSFQRLREVLSALNFGSDDLPLDQDLVQLIAIAGQSESVAEFVCLAHTEPARFEAMWDEGSDELIEELRSTRIPWTKIHRLVPQLAAAITVMESPS